MKKTITKTPWNCHMKKLRALATLLLVGGIFPAYAATVNVSSLSALQTAINNASAGDTIVLANGVYTTSSDITISKQGTSAQHIVIKAASVLGAEIKGSYGFIVNSPAKYIDIIGFKFTHAPGKAKLSSGTSFIKVWQCLYQCPGDGDYFELNGSDRKLVTALSRTKPDWVSSLSCADPEARSRSATRYTITTFTISLRKPVTEMRPYSMVSADTVSPTLTANLSTTFLKIVPVKMNCCL